MNIGILGAGITGFQSAISAKKLGYNVFLSDIKGKNDIKKDILDILEKNHINTEFGKNTLAFFKDCEEIILSPGIPENDFIKKLSHSGKLLISDIDFAYEHMGNSKWIGITGTNGKTTTTALLGEIFKTKYKTFMGGNIGASPTKAIGNDIDFFIIEMSSYQLDISKKVRFDNSLILNITEDHLNRYKTMSKYINSKLQIVQMTNGKCFINGDDAILNKITGKNIAKFGVKNDHNKEIFYEEKRELLNIRGKKIHRKEIKLMGIHNIYNIIGASLLALEHSIDENDIISVLKDFKSLPHRIELLGKIKGVKIYNDSKSTTPDSTYYAMKTFEKNRVFLIMGGSDEKRSDFSILKNIIEKDNVFTYIVGKGAAYILKQLKSKNVKGPLTIEESVKLALMNAQKGDIILFSPGCPSFDRFENYKKRGEFFKQLINES